jgi:hypothetical protein
VRGVSVAQFSADGDLNGFAVPQRPRANRASRLHCAVSHSLNVVQLVVMKRRAATAPSRTTSDAVRIISCCTTLG